MRLLITLLLGCGGPDPEVSAVPAKTASAVTPELVAQTWQVRMAVDATRAPFEGRTSWIEYFQGHRVSALQNFASESDPQGLARLHAEMSAIYRQAALMAAHSTVQVYGQDAQPTDPAEVSYLLGVSGALLGDTTLRARLGSAGGSKVAGISERDGAWKKWSDAGAVWPPNEPAAGSPGAPGPAAPGTAPDIGALPHYELPELAEGGLLVKAGDPGTLWALAQWHEARALEAAPELAGAISALIDPWRLPAERGASAAAGGSTGAVGSASGTSPGTWPDTLLFMSVSTTAGDVQFLSDLERNGPAAVAAHVGDSPYAAMVQHCTNDAKVAVDCVLDESAALGQAIEAGMAAAAGREDTMHRSFADFARVGALRAADRAAAAMQDTDTSGRLRINALDRNVGNARDPLFLISVAAWDAGNRNSVRAEELVHGLLTEVPGLEAARLPLDALHIRLSRNAAPGRPMH